MKFANIGDTDSNVGVIFCMWKTGLIAAALAAGLAGAANAHPHVFVESRAEVVFDEAKKDGVSARPFYQRSLCAAAFSPDGTLLFAIGTDDQHTLGVAKTAHICS